jgi:hypothetical protein
MSLDEGLLSPTGSITASVIAEEAEESPHFDMGGNSNNNSSSSADIGCVPKDDVGGMSGKQLMERLNSLAAKNAAFEERRHRYQKRSREDWRTRTQPVTLEEIQQADR